MVASTTLKKQALKSKQKNYIRGQKLEVLKTAVGINTSLLVWRKHLVMDLGVEDKEILS